MTIEIYSPPRSEQQALSDIIIRSKAHWGYSQEQMTNWHDELVLLEKDWTPVGGDLAAARLDGEILGIAQLLYEEEECTPEICVLDKLFIDPQAMGKGAGKALLEWAKQKARQRGYRTILLFSDPNAEGFYEHQGVKRIGSIASTFEPGRLLPQMAIDLT